jgi:hypothetical protein
MIMLVLTLCDIICHDPSLGFTTKTRALKGVGWECNLGITFTLSEMWMNVREWAHTFPSGLQLWELEFWWTSEFLENDLKGQNSLYWGFPYIIGKILKIKCLKWGHISIWIISTQVMTKRRVKNQSVNLDPDH